MLAKSRPDALVMGDQGRRGGVRTGVQISLRHGDTNRWTIGVTGEQERTAGRNHRQVGLGVLSLGAFLAECGNREVDQRGVNRREIPVSEAALGQITRSFRFDQEIRTGNQSLQLAAVIRAVQVERDTALIPIERPKVERTVGMRFILVEGTTP